MHIVDLKPDGTRIDIGNGFYDYPLSLDLKITNYCETGCPWCHESSGPLGKHSDPGLLLEKLKGLPRNTEIAIGGGNPLSHPKLGEIFRGLSDFGYITKITIRDKDITKSLHIPSEVKGLGISVTPGISPKKYLDFISSRENLVAHMILGINTIEDYIEVKKYFPRILWLGFKTWGRNKDSKLPDINELRRKIIQDLYYGRSGILAFDNLGINQLNLKSAFLKNEWEKYYLGPEFTSSMYVDAVKGEFAGYSTSGDRISWNEMSLINYFRSHAKNIK